MAKKSKTPSKSMQKIESEIYDFFQMKWRKERQKSKISSPSKRFKGGW